MALFGRLKHIQSPKDDAENEKQRLVGLLTPREADLFYLLLEGYTLKESAKELSVKYSTANTHMTAIYKKLMVIPEQSLLLSTEPVVKASNKLLNPL